MKKLLLFCLFLSGWATSFAQDYVPFLQNIGWCVEHYIGTGSVMTGYSHEGDTTIGTITYTKLTHDDNLFLVREDVVSRKVWVILPDSTSEVLLYDFNPLSGPEFILNYVGYGPVTYSLVSRDSIITPLGMRERIILATSDTVFDPNISWIEGIGSGYGPVYLFDPTYAPGIMSSGHCLICSYIDVGVQSYAGNCGISCIPYPGSACYDFMTGMDNLHPGSEHITVQCLPDNMILIKAEGSRISEVHVYGTQGTLFKKQSGIHAGECRLSANGWSAGLYLIEVTLDDGSRFTRKIIRS